MATSLRGALPQFDIERPRACAWRSQLTPMGKTIFDIYTDVGVLLETVGYASENAHTLYFPGGAG